MIDCIMTKEDFAGYKYLVNHDGRRAEIHHVSNQTVFFTELVLIRDWNGKPITHLDKNGLCRIALHWVEQWITPEYEGDKVRMWLEKENGERKIVKPQKTC